MQKLKGCPCCGGRAAKRRNNDGFYFVQCSRCGMRTSPSQFCFVVANVWNHRNKETEQ